MGRRARRASGLCPERRRARRYRQDRLDFPGYTGEESLEEISWDDWFRKFDENGLALMVQDSTAAGEKSNFNKIVSRETAKERPRTRTAR